MTKKGEWLLVLGENYFSLIPEFCCSNCSDTISTYDPPKICRKCWSINEYKEKSIPARIEDLEESVNAL